MIRARLGTVVALPTMLAAAAGARAAQSGFDLINMPRGVTNVSRRIYGLHMMAFWVCVGIAVVVFGVMIWSIVFHRRSRGAVADVTMVHNTKVEIVWTAIPVAILVFMAVPAARLLVRINNNSHAQVNIRVTGFQWGWHYQYVGTPVSIISKLAEPSNAARELDSGINPDTVPHYLLSVDHPIEVPVGEKIRLLITSVDVIHSWWVPDFGVKKDAIPGYINEASFTVDPDKPGVYRGQCTELCGRDHAFMPIVVKAVSPSEFQAWLQRQAAPQKQAAAAAAPTAVPGSSL
jgi:cytochrome c oxidase subunit 2